MGNGAGALSREFDNPAEKRRKIYARVVDCFVWYSFALGNFVHICLAFFIFDLFSKEQCRYSYAKGHKLQKALASAK